MRKSSTASLHAYARQLRAGKRGMALIMIVAMVSMPWILPEDVHFGELMVFFIAYLLLPLIWTALEIAAVLHEILIELRAAPVATRSGNQNRRAGTFEE